MRLGVGGGAIKEEEELRFVSVEGSIVGEGDAMMADEGTIEYQDT